jgi:hypothetical protein
VYLLLLVDLVVVELVKLINQELHQPNRLQVVLQVMGIQAVLAVPTLLVLAVAAEAVAAAELQVLLAAVQVLVTVVQV